MMVEEKKTKLENRKLDSIAVLYAKQARKMTGSSKPRRLTMVRKLLMS